MSFSMSTAVSVKYLSLFCKESRGGFLVEGLRHIGDAGRADDQEWPGYS